MGVVSHFYLKGFGAKRGRLKGRGGKKWIMGKGKKKDDGRMDAQVLLLIDPGAELGWAELSDRLPSGGGERKHNMRTKVILQPFFFLG